MKNAYWMLTVLLALTAAMSACAPEEENTSPGKLRFTCASLSGSSTCTPGTSAIHPLGQVITGVTVVQGDVVYAATLAENVGEEPVTFRPMFGLNIWNGFGACSNPAAAWCWGPQDEAIVGAGEKYPINIGNTVNELGDHEFWTLALAPSFLNFMGGYAALVGADFDPEDPAIQPYILDFARVEFTVVAP